MLFNKQKNTKEAQKWFEKALILFTKVDNKLGMGGCYNNIGDLYFKNNQVEKAKEFHNKALELSQELGYPDMISSSSKYLYNIYLKSKNYKNALESYTLYVTMKDSVSKIENKKLALKQQFQYEYEKKETELKLEQEKTNLIHEQQVQRQRIIIITTFIIILVVVVFSIFLYNRFKIIKKQKNIIEIQKRQTEEQKIIVEEKNEELNQLIEEIEAQRDQIEEQKQKIEATHHEVTSSIAYAERIQNALFDTSEQWQAISPEHFILFKPRDVVSGDFYWAHSFQGHTPSFDFAQDDQASQEGNLCIWAAADCTGHGVPGAFMSMLGVSFLNEIVVEGNETNAGKILDKLRSKIIQSFKQQNTEYERKDGMDIAICVLNKSNNVLQYAGAYNPLWLVRPINSLLELEEGEKIKITTSQTHQLIEFKADRMPIGKHFKENISFTTHQIQLQKGDIIYTFSDGFQDQFGGVDNNKYLSSSMRKFILNIQNLPLNLQKDALSNEHQQWIKAGTSNQIDDVCIVGIKI